MNNRNIAIGVGVIILLYFLSRKKTIVDTMVDDAVGGGGGGGGIFPIIDVEVPKEAEPKKNYFFSKIDLPPVKEGAGTKSKVADEKPLDVMTDQQAQTNKSSASTTTGTGIEIAQGDVLQSTQSSSTTTSSTAGAINSSAGSNTAGSSKDPFSPFDGFYEVKSKYEFD